jgi:hypothetical protein
VIYENAGRQFGQSRFEIAQPVLDAESPPEAAVKGKRAKPEQSHKGADDIGRVAYNPVSHAAKITVTR